VKVLVVDSNPLIRRIVHSYLAPIRYDVVEMADEPAAADLLRHQQIPILLTTWPMPGGDGVALLQRVRAKAEPGYTYVILMSERDQQAALIAGLEAGADDYLIKPLNLKELRRRVLLGGRVHKLESRLQRIQRERDSLLNGDPLTALLNRQSIYAQVEMALEQYERERQHFSLVLLELDQLETINDRHGYHAGDQALRLVADAITRAIRHHDAVGRWRGAQFLLLLPETTAETAASVAERVRGHVATLGIAGADGQRIRLHVNQGIVSTAEAEDAMLPALLWQTEHALKQSRAQEQHRFHLLQREW